MATDLTFNIAALDKASATFVALAAQVDRVGERLDTLDRKKANPKVDLDTSNFDRKVIASEKNLDAFSQRGQTQLIALGATLAAGALTGGALLAIPAAFAAIGIAAEKSNPEVRQSFSELTVAAKETAQDGFEPLVPALVGFADQAKLSLGVIKPELAEGAAAAAPLLRILGTDFIKATEQGVGASVPIIQSLRPVVQAAGDDFVKFEQGVAGLLQNLNTGSAAQGLSVLGDDLEQLLPAVGSLVSDVIPLGNAMLQVLGPALTNVAQSAGALTPVLSAAASVISLLGPDITAFAPPLVAASVATKVLTGSWTDFGGAASKIKPIFTDFSGTMDSLGQKIGITSAATNKAAAEQAAQTAVASELAKAESDVALSEAEQAFAAESSEKNAVALVAAQEAQAAAATTAAEAETALAATTEAASFSFGPLGIALGAVALLALPFITNTGQASQKAQDLTTDLTHLAQAAPGAAAGILQGNGPLTNLVNVASEAQVNVKAMLAAYNGGPQALRAFTDSVKANHDALGQQQVTSGAVQGSIQQVALASRNSVGIYNNLSDATKRQVDQYNAQGTVLGQLNIGIGDLTSQQSASLQITGQTGSAQEQASEIAGALGIRVRDAAAAYNELASGQTFAMSATQQASDTILGQVLAVDTANSTVQNYFKQAGQAVTQAQQSLSDASHSAEQAVTAVADAQHSYAQSVSAVADAQHSYQQAQQAVTTTEQGVVTAQNAVKDALTGVATAERDVTKARQGAQQAQVVLTQAEAAATEQLKQLHLQLADQVTSEESARVALFDAVQSGGTLGVTAANAQRTASKQVTAANEDQIKAALAVVQAQNSLNDTMNTGTNLRKQVSDTDKAGVAGSAQVIQAQQALKAAQDQVTSSEQGVLKAQQAVRDAQAGVVKAEQGVSDAVYGQQKARMAVTEAIYNEQKASQAISEAHYNEQKAAQAVTTAKQSLGTAEDNASHSMDANTAAGQRNIAMLKQVAEQLFANEDPQKAGNDLVKATATLFGTSTTNVAKYLKELGLIPKNFKFGVTAVAAADLSHIPVITPGGLAEKLSHFAGGGLLRGPGTKTSDSIPAMLSDGEYVVRASQTKKHLPLLEAINAGVPHFASGGFAGDAALVNANAAWSSFGVSYTDVLDTLKVMDLPTGTAKPLPAYTPPVLKFADPGLVGSRAANEKIVQSVWASMFGWTGAEWAATVPLLMQESGFNNVAQNPTSTAYGMFQFLNSTWGGYGIPKTSDPTQQSIAGGRYISSRYGDPIAALAHEHAFNWYAKGGKVKAPKVYDSGGMLGPGEVGTNRGRRPEAVLTPEESEAFIALAKSINGGGSGKSPIEMHVHQAPGVSVDAVVSEVMRRLEFVGR